MELERIKAVTKKRRASGEADAAQSRLVRVRKENVDY